MQLQAIHFSDPGCPWAYSARPYHARLRWRFGDQVAWRLVVIGLTESHQQYVARGYTPQWSADVNRMFAGRFGMPFAFEPKDRVSATSPACRAIVAVRRERPELTEEVFRALQFQHFTTPARLDDPDALSATLDTVDGLDGRAIVGTLDDRRGARGLRGRPRAGAHRRGDADARPAPDRRDRRPGPLHGAVRALRAPRRAQLRGRRLPAVRELRHGAGEPRARARAPRCPGRAARRPPGVPRGAHDRGGRRGAPGRPRGAGSRRDARRADRARRGGRGEREPLAGDALWRAKPAA